LSAFFVTSTLSRGTTATTENSAPSGFQHLVQPQAWLCAVCEVMPLEDINRAFDLMHEGKVIRSVIRY
jgi:hypothetical protein